MAAIRIVQASPAERGIVLDLVVRLLRELEDAPEEFRGFQRPQMLRDLAKAGDRLTALLARTGSNESVGVVTVMEAFAIYAGGNYGIIDEMYVAPGYRSSGIGTLLVEAVKGLGRRKGWMRIDVTAPPEPRWQRTVKFYERQGFTFSGPKLRCMLR